MRSRVLECGACGHRDFHCLASGCNHDDCECERRTQVTEVELAALEKLAMPGYETSDWRERFDWRENAALRRLMKKGAVDVDWSLTASGEAVVLGCPPEDLAALLRMVGGPLPTIVALQNLTRAEREVIWDWARREYLHASDNVVRRRMRPAAILDRLPKQKVSPCEGGWCACVEHEDATAARVLFRRGAP